MFPSIQKVDLRFLENMIRLKYGTVLWYGVKEGNHETIFWQSILIRLNIWAIKHISLSKWTKYVDDNLWIYDINLLETDEKIVNIIGKEIRKVSFPQSYLDWSGCIFQIYRSVSWLLVHFVPEVCKNHWN